MFGEGKRFFAWSSDNKEKIFDLQKNTSYYCQQEVKTLRDTCSLYRNKLMVLICNRFYEKEGDENMQLDQSIDPFSILHWSLLVWSCTILCSVGTVALLPLHMANTEEDKEMMNLLCSIAVLGAGAQVLVVGGLQGWSL